jgi:5-bromo-4-chloroindolyl phosphate hydrolysis protein
MFRRPSYTRAVQLAEKAGMSEEGLVLIEAAYGRISAEDAQNAIKDLSKLAEEAKAIEASVAECEPLQT